MPGKTLYFVFVHTTRLLLCRAESIFVSVSTSTEHVIANHNITVRVLVKDTVLKIYVAISKTQVRKVFSELFQQLKWKTNCFMFKNLISLVRLKSSVG